MALLKLDIPNETDLTPEKLGCGSAIPSLVLFHYAITQSLPLYFTFTDFNASVLRLATVPNLLLTWVKCLPNSTDAGFDSLNPNPLHASPSGDLEITPSLISSFVSALQALGIHITLISGSWNPAEQFLSLIPVTSDMSTLALASETIYSPASLETFTEALVLLLKRVRTGKAIIAAKRIYFGVGGSADAFKRRAAELGAVASEIEPAAVHQGVARCLIEVQMM